MAGIQEGLGRVSSALANQCDSGTDGARALANAYAHTSRPLCFVHDHLAVGMYRRPSYHRYLEHEPGHTGAHARRATSDSRAEAIRVPAVTDITPRLAVRICRIASPHLHDGDGSSRHAQDRAQAPP